MTSTMRCTGTGAAQGTMRGPEALTDATRTIPFRTGACRKAARSKTSTVVCQSHSADIQVNSSSTITPFCKAIVSWSFAACEMAKVHFKLVSAGISRVILINIDVNQRISNLMARALVISIHNRWGHCAKLHSAINTGLSLV